MNLQAVLLFLFISTAFGIECWTGQISEGTADGKPTDFNAFHFGPCFGEPLCLKFVGSYFDNDLQSTGTSYLCGNGPGLTCDLLKTGSGCEDIEHSEIIGSDTSKWKGRLCCASSFPDPKSSAGSPSNKPAGSPPGSPPGPPSGQQPSPPSDSGPSTSAPSTFSIPVLLAIVISCFYLVF